MLELKFVFLGSILAFIGCLYKPCVSFIIIRSFLPVTWFLNCVANKEFIILVIQCTSAIAQLSKGRTKEDKDSPDLQSLATAALEKEYKQRASGKLTVLASAFKSLKVSS